MNAVHTWLDKIKHVADRNGTPAALDIDLMLEHTRRLYEAILELHHEDSTPEATIPAPDPGMSTAEPMFQNIPDAVNEPQLVMEPEPDRMTAAVTVEIQEAEQDQEPEPVLHTIPATLEEENIPETTVPASATPAELYSSKMTTFQVSGRDMRMYIGINDKYNFISELFAGNNEAYEEILDEINTFETKEDALFFLSNSGVTTLYHWDEEAFSVRIFYNVLSQFFASR